MQASTDAKERMMRGIKWWAAMGVLCCSAVCAQSTTPSQQDNVSLEVQAVARELLPIQGLWMRDRMALTDAGVILLETLATLWQREFVRIDRVRVVGHVLDPQSQNERAVALQRTRLVEQTLMAKGGLQWRYLTEVLPLDASTLSACGGIAAARLVQECPLDSHAMAIEVMGVRR